MVASARTLARFGHQRLRLTVNDRPAVADTPLLFVGNNDYRLELPGSGSRDSLDDGRLCVLVMRSKSRAGFVAATRELKVTPHVARNTSGRRSAIDGRTKAQRLWPAR